MHNMYCKYGRRVSPKKLRLWSIVDKRVRAEEEEDRRGPAGTHLRYNKLTRDSHHETCTALRLGICLLTSLLIVGFIASLTFLLFTLNEGGGQPNTTVLADITLAAASDNIYAFESIIIILLYYIDHTNAYDIIRSRSELTAGSKHTRTSCTYRSRLGMFPKM